MNGLRYENISCWRKWKNSNYKCFTGGQNGIRRYLNYDNIPCGESRHWIYDVTSPEKENEGVFSWGRSLERRGGYDPIIKEYRPYILESFYYCDADTERLLPYFGDFMLDSGAFTFMNNMPKKEINWDEYIERYADFINRNKVNKYFELDIDKVVGYERVKEYRRILENKVNKQCIPVWHKNRGIEEFKKHCQEYPYVSIGGYVVKELTPKDYEAFPAMIKYAHLNNAKIHCLGFTKLDSLSKYHFDSVDSTAWTTGNRFGYIYKFDGVTMRKIEPPRGYRLGDSKKVALINYIEWIKFQKYAEMHL